MLGDVERVARFARANVEFQPRADDIWIVTYPRSGTTWLQYLLHRLLGRPPGFEHIDDVCPWFERSLAIGHRRAADLDALPRPRIFKSHLLPKWVPRSGRFIYMERDGLAVAQSYYALHRDYLRFTGSFEEFFARFLRGEVQYGSWFEHTRAWEHERRRRVLLVRYERFRTDPEAELRALAEQLGLPHDASRVREACADASLSVMRAEQDRFDHATALLRELGVRRGEFVRHGRIEGEHDLGLAFRQRLEAARGVPPIRARLRDFLH